MNQDQDQIMIYKSPDDGDSYEVKLESESVWLSRQQLSLLFERDKKTIGKHINTVLKDGELEREAVVAKFATTAKDGKTYQTEHYNLEMIISVGNRVNSKRGTQFRIWANKVLKEYLRKGYAIDEKRLREKTEQLSELKQIIQIQEEIIQREQVPESAALGLLKVIASYAKALDFLDDYDHGRLKLPQIAKGEIHRITYKEAIKAISLLGQQKHVNDELFARERDNSFRSSLDSIYQTFDGKDLYLSLEEKAAHLLYFVVKNHSFTDGNKRIAAFLFVWFLDINRHLFSGTGRLISDETLVALTLMLAKSAPSDKEIMIKVVVNLINSDSV